MSAEGAPETIDQVKAVEQEVTEETEADDVVQPEEVRLEEQKETKEEAAGAVANEAADPTTLTPALSQREREGTVRAEHPAGEVFFRGNVEEVTENEAEEIARRQLARSGLLRGQKVREAD